MKRRGIPDTGWRRLAAVLAVVVCVGFSTVCGNAQADSTGTAAFSVQVSPSPLVATIKPGETTTLDLQIRNTSSSTQRLKLGLRSFAVDEATGDVRLGAKAPSTVSQFVSFSDPAFTAQAGQIVTEHVIIHTPAAAGFSYSFAISISQQNPPKPQTGASSVQGSVAVFTLLTVDRPGATRQLNLEQFSVSKHVYEYLPATISVELKNDGNTIAQPTGNIFVQRHSNDKVPLATIPVNQAGGYILPGSSRVLTTTWNNGFPHYVTATDSSGRPTSHLSWDGGDFTKLRFGHYIAKLVAVYNDGQRDVPITAEVTFWVIPWRILLLLLVILLVIVVGIWTIFRNSTRVIKRNSGGHAKSRE